MRYLVSVAPEGNPTKPLASFYVVSDRDIPLRDGLMPNDIILATGPIAMESASELDNRIAEAIKTHARTE